jgi:hypothetical protein
MACAYVVSSRPSKEGALRQYEDQAIDTKNAYKGRLRYTAWHCTLNGLLMNDIMESVVLSWEC